MPYCPHCREEISHLNYEADTEGYESGICNTDGGDWDCDDSGTNDHHNITYTCPECENECSPSDVLDDLDDDEDDEDEDNEEDDSPMARLNENETEDIKTRNVSHFEINNPAGFSSIKSKECPECHTRNIIEGEDAAICSHCNCEL